MKKIFSFLWGTVKNFFLNSFWRTWPILLIIVLSLALNAILWYIYELKIKQNPLPFFFASGLIILNLILANFLWNKEKLASVFLLSTGLLVQFLMLMFIRYLTMVF